MKKIRNILIILILTSCNHVVKKNTQFENLRIEDIKAAEIRINKMDLVQDSTDIVRNIPFEHLDLLIDCWNKPDKVEIRKYFPTHIITLKLQNDSIRTFRLSGKSVKEKSDYTIISNNINLADTIWILSY